MIAAAAAFAAALRAGDGLGEFAGAEAVLERLGAEVTVVWGVRKPELGPHEVHWLDAGHVPMRLLTEAEAHAEAGRRASWQVVRREGVVIRFITDWAQVTT